MFPRHRISVALAWALGLTCLGIGDSRLVPGAAAAAAAESAPTSESGGPRLRPRRFALTDADRTYWAFQPVREPAVPSQVLPELARQPVDAFHLAPLLAKGLVPNPSATPRELVRRLSFDLLGLPPDPQDVEDFAREPSDAAWARLVDRYLASPHYGERWGRHWLDLVRFAESNGYERDGPKPNAWRYRDYVIRAFNEDKPYDRFIREQIAGDEIADGLPAEAAGGPEWRDAIIATGFYRLHVWDDEPDNTLVAEFDDLDDIMVTMGTAFLGLTVGCARCHDHKYDPLSQSDYYSLLSFVRNIDPYGQHHTGGGGRGTGRIQRPLASTSEIKAWETARQTRIKEAETRLAQATNAPAPGTDPELRQRLESELKQARDASPPFEYALAIAESAPKPTYVLARGDVSTPREEVFPAFPSVLGPSSTPADASPAGRRRRLADWIASPANPLTARVMVNRLWQHHFGVGLVSTPDDFGLTGVRPGNLPLLDYLASRFVASGWSVKAVHRLILHSRAYRMSSRATDAHALGIDEANALLWRQNLRRLEAEIVRDSMLAVAGTLNPRAGGPSVFPSLPKEVHTTQDSAGKGWSDSPPEDQNRRSVYLVVKRALKVPLLESLDFVNCTSPTGSRPTTTTAPQALMLLNDGFVQQQARAFARRLVASPDRSPEARIRLAFRLALQRPPTVSELASSLRFLREPHGASGDDPQLESLCRALLNLNEALYVD